MKLTKLQLKQIIKEEIEAELQENEEGFLSMLMHKLDNLEQKVDAVLFGSKERPPSDTLDQDILDQEKMYADEPPEGEARYIPPNER